MPGIGDYGSSSMRAASELVTQTSTEFKRGGGKPTERLDDKLNLTPASTPKQRFEALEKLVNTGTFPDGSALSKEDAKTICKSVRLNIPMFGSAKKSLQSALTAYKMQSLQLHGTAGNSSNNSLPEARNMSSYLSNVSSGLTQAWTKIEGHNLSGEPRQASEALDKTINTLDRGMSREDGIEILNSIAEKASVSPFNGSKRSDRKKLLLQLGFSEVAASELSKNARSGTLRAILNSYIKLENTKSVGERSIGRSDSFSSVSTSASEAETVIARPSSPTGTWHPINKRNLAALQDLKELGVSVPAAPSTALELNSLVCTTYISMLPEEKQGEYSAMKSPMSAAQFSHLQAEAFIAKLPKEAGNKYKSIVEAAKARNSQLGAGHLENIKMSVQIHQLAEKNGVTINWDDIKTKDDLSFILESLRS